MRQGFYSYLLFLSACVLALPACPGHIDDPEPFVGGTDASISACLLGVTNVEQQLVRPRCATSGCHDRATRSEMLDLESPNLASRLLGVTSPRCAGRVLVDPASPASGYFMEKLAAASPRCGERMPLGSPPLTPSEITCVRQWLATLGTDGGTTMDATLDVPRDAMMDVGADRRDVVMDARVDTTMDSAEVVDVTEDIPEDVMFSDEGDATAMDAARPDRVDAATDTAEVGLDASVTSDVRDVETDRAVSSDVRDSGVDVTDIGVDSRDSAVDSDVMVVLDAAPDA
jgi:hypothetical protein